MVWSCLPFIRSGQNHLARHSEREKETTQTGEKVGRQHQGMDRPVVRQVPEGSGEQGKMEKTGCEVICGAPMTLAVKGLMMMMMIMMRRVCVCVCVCVHGVCVCVCVCTLFMRMFTTCFQFVTKHLRPHGKKQSCINVIDFAF